MSGRNKKNLIIIALIAIVVVMSVAYAAFATSLNITGTSNIASNWNIEITNITTLEKSSGASNAAGSPTYDNTNGLTASINTTLTSPGDYAIYKIEVTNKGSLNAVLSSITGPTNNNNDIIFYVNKNQNNEDITDTSRMIGANDILNARGDSNNLDKGYVYVTVLYRDYENQQTPEIATANATVTLNFTQSSSGSSPDTINGTIYRLSSDTWNSNQDISSMTAGEDYVTTAAAVTSMDSMGAIFYLKHTVVNSVVTESYVCFITDTEHCMQGGGSEDSNDTSIYYKYEEQGGNWAVLKSQEPWFQAHEGSCDFSGDSRCNDNTFSEVSAGRNGDVAAFGPEGTNCIVNYDGSSSCSGSGSSGESGSGSSHNVINGTIYRWSQDNWSVNQDISSMTEGEDYVTTAGAVTNMDALGAKFYLKHTVVNNIVIDNYVCFVSDAEHCLKAGGAQTSESVSPYYKYEEQGGNWAVIKSQESWFENANGSCSFDSSSSHCEGGGFSSVYVSAYGGVDVYDSDSSSRGCIATNEGSSRCN